jgi:hypothetical protein
MPEPPVLKALNEALQGPSKALKGLNKALNALDRPSSPSIRPVNEISLPFPLGSHPQANSCNSLYLQGETATLELSTGRPCKALY